MRPARDPRPAVKIQLDDAEFDEWLDGLKRLKAKSPSPGERAAEKRLGRVAKRWQKLRRAVRRRRGG